MKTERFVDFQICISVLLRFVFDWTLSIRNLSENGKKVLKFKSDHSENTETGKTVEEFTFYYSENKEIGKKLSNLRYIIVC